MRSRKVPPDFAPVEILPALKGEVGRCGHAYKFSYVRAGGKFQTNYFYDFGRHPYRDLIGGYIRQSLERLTASSISTYCKYFELLEEFMTSMGEGELNPESFLLFVRWLLETGTPSGGRRFKDSSIPSVVHAVKALYRFGVDTGYTGWKRADLDVMTEAAAKALRGCQGRATQDAVERALSLQTFSDLARAVALEFEQCKAVFREWQAGLRDSPYNFKARFMGIIDPNPLVVFALQAVMRHGLRAEELNALTAADLRVDDQDGRHELYVHAPNKRDDYVPVDDAFVTSWRLCEAWSREARNLAGPGGREVFGSVLFVYPPAGLRHSRPLMQFSTYVLNQSHLPYFFKKWFGYKVKGEGGGERPLLHAEGDPTRPLRINYDRLRNAFAVRFAERVENRAALSRVMRHSRLTTAERYYLHQTRLDHAKKVHIALKSEAAFLAMSLRNPVAAGVSEETLRRAREAGAVLPHGLCGAAVEGQGCRRASDCLECPFLVVIESRRPRFVADREAYIERAGRLEAEGDWRGAENMLSRAKVCEAHLIRMDGIFRGGERDEHVAKESV